MTTGDMFKNMLVLKAMLIFVSFTVFSFGNMTVFMVLGLLMLLIGGFLAFKQGVGMGHESCSISSSLKHIAEADKMDQVERKMLKQAFSMSNGIKSLFAGALIDYVINAVYIICMLLQVEETPLLISRLLSYVMVIPYWPIVSHWHEVFNVLTWDIVALLMISPFVLPAIQFAGYCQGPKSWAKTEKAMADGKRRAKARSRIGRKKKGTPRSQRPEI